MKVRGLSLFLALAVMAHAAPPGTPAPASAPALPPQDQPKSTRPPVPTPAFPLPAPAPLKLTFTAPRQKIEGGQLTRHTLRKSWTLPAKWVARSREYGKVTSYLGPLLTEVERAVNVKGRPARFFERPGGWIATDQPEWTFDRAATRQALLKAILTGENAAAIVFQEKRPERSVTLLAERGVLGHLATARSSFAGSPDFRSKNVVVGASKFDYAFVAPNGEFNFNGMVGEVSARTGFVPGYVIAGDSLALEDGGGLCQVSTTAFRALWEAGLPVVERHQHSHRVRYYDPIGYEATVYAPYKNLRMNNDTGAHLFFQVTWNTRSQKLRFDVFGTDTGRRVRVSGPVVTDLKPPAAPSFMADERVAPGQQRLLDGPMEGMTSVLTRTVTFADGRTRTDEIRSVYKPWGAVYAVHPHDPRLPAEQMARK